MPLFILPGASVLTGGVAAPIAWMFCGVWGVIRVNESSKVSGMRSP